MTIGAKLASSAITLLVGAGDGTYVLDDLSVTTVQVTSAS